MGDRVRESEVWSQGQGHKQTETVGGEKQRTKELRGKQRQETGRD